MRIANGDQSPTEQVDASHTHGIVSRRGLGTFDKTNGRAVLITFQSGARTHWHRHTGGQLLYVVAGEGRISVRNGEEMRLRPGDLVYAPPNEEHWHGALSDGEMTHLALSFGTTEWLEEVQP